MLVTIDKAAKYRLHGITILDEDGNPIPYVQTFDTETMQVTMREGAVGSCTEFSLTAADYKIYYHEDVDRAWFEEHLPDKSMLDHLVKFTKVEA